MIKFTFPEYRYLDHIFGNLADGQFSINRFQNREMNVTLKTNVKNEDCLIIGTIAPPDENFISTLFLSHTLKKEGAEKIILFSPYLAYTRHDKEKPGESLLTEEIGNLLKASHISSVITLDVHSQKIKDLYPLPVASISTSKLFAEKVKELSLKNPTFIAPDEGSVSRVLELFNGTGRHGTTTYFKKIRTGDKVTSVLQGEVSDEAILIDDMLDTGRTLVISCEALKTKGVTDIYIFVTHGLFVGDEWKKLLDLGVKKIYCTDSIPNPKFTEISNLTVLPISDLVKDYFLAVNE